MAKTLITKYSVQLSAASLLCLLALHVSGGCNSKENSESSSSGNDSNETRIIEVDTWNNGKDEPMNGPAAAKRVDYATTDEWFSELIHTDDEFGALTNDQRTELIAAMREKSTDARVDVSEVYEATLDEDPDTTYFRKTIELSGTVEQFRLRQLFAGHPVIPQLWITVDGKSGRSITCTTLYDKPWKEVLPGQTVVIKGIVSTGTPPTMTNAIILEKDAREPERMTAIELSTKFAADPETTEQELKALGYFIITGKVAELDEEDQDWFRFATENGQELYVNTNGKTERAFGLKLGDEIEVICEHPFVTGDPNLVMRHGIVLME